ncbi:ribosome-binding factor A [Pseudochelatococcus lubricantis]|uniref:Ribosome-binding factor A n=1 Tax=Pseudochelatococcus lubricantis TaxID=1538102 RepID=A0ABX0V1S1_9HYPH|nr:30S ribosome-binding factor RbfA [Pseudochelatococcus lubricantis]NIJ58155.1 ribosome-binding factor A [Pseudochelatococcus lubricantis]
MSRRKFDAGSGPSQRGLRVGELVRHALAEILMRGEVHDDVLASHVITVPEVRMSPDLRLATAYIIPLGGKDSKPVLAALERNRRLIRTEVAQRINLRYAPDIRFRLDESFDEASHIDSLLRASRVVEESIDQEDRRDDDDDDGDHDR